MSAVSGTPQTELVFDDAILQFIDEPDLFTPEENFRILQTLKLQLSE